MIICSSTCFACMATMVQLVGDLPTMEKALFRNLIALCIVLVPVAKDPGFLKLPPKSVGVVLLRAIAGTAGMVMNFYAISHLHLADANILNKLSPIFAIVFSAFMLKETVRPVQIGAVVTAMIGAVLVIKPGGNVIPLLPALIGFGGGIMAGLSYTCLRKAQTRGASAKAIVFIFSALSVLITGPLMLFDFVMPSSRQLLLLLLCGVFGAGGQFFITAAYSYAPAREISIYDFTQVLIAAAIGYLLFGQLPDALSVIGYIVIIGSAIVNFVYNQRKHEAHKEFITQR